MNPRGRLRRRRREQTNDFRTDPIGSQKWSISALNDGRDPLFSTIFSRTCDRSSIDLVQKCSVIFLHQTNKQTNKRRTGFWPDRSLANAGLVAQKSGSESVRSILLRSCLKSTSGTLVCTLSKLRLRRNKTYVLCIVEIHRSGGAPPNDYNGDLQKIYFFFDFLILFCSLSKINATRVFFSTMPIHIIFEFSKIGLLDAKLRLFYDKM